MRLLITADLHYNHAKSKPLADDLIDKMNIEPADVLVVVGDIAIVGSVGWYDYSFAAKQLGIPRRFYAAKLSPGAAGRFMQYADLFQTTDDILPIAREVVARWNDGKFVRLHRSDDEFLQEILDRLQRQLVSLAGQRHVVACIHHLPFHELLPPSHSSQWDFVKAYLVSERLGRLLLTFPNVRDVFCGHSHLPVSATIGDLRAVNIGSGYRWKTYKVVDLES